MSDIKEKIEKLLEKATNAEKSEDALRFSQAALNAAHAKQIHDTYHK